MCLILRASRLILYKYKMYPLICEILGLTVIAQSDLVVYLDNVLSSSRHSGRNLMGK